MHDLLGKPEDDHEVQAARAIIAESGPVPAILVAQHPEGYWVKSGPAYEGHNGTMNSVTYLAQLGAVGTHVKIKTACEYVLPHCVSRNGSFSVIGVPSNYVPCFGGQIEAALIDLGWLGDERLHRALEWHARTVTGEGVSDVDTKGTAERYYKSGTSGSGFACIINIGLPCGWGAVKAMKASSIVPPDRRTPIMETANEQGVEFLLSRDPTVADYPFGMGTRPSGSWLRFGYPLNYATGVLENLEVLTRLGYASDLRLANALAFVGEKQDVQGCCKLEHTYNLKTWPNI